MRTVYASTAHDPGAPGWVRIEIIKVKRKGFT